jgi:hypothetical protein
MASESNNLRSVMSAPKAAVTLELWRDHWSQGMPETALVEVATKARSDLETRSYREAFNGNENARMVYTNLRWILLVLSKSRVARARSLTWRERITGRLNP